MSINNLRQQVQQLGQNLNNAIKKEQTTQALNGSILGPWSSNTPAKGSFFTPIEIDGKRFDKLYPYRLLVVEHSGNGEYTTVKSSGVVGVSSSTKELGPGSWQIAFKPTASEWAYQLPITPQQLSITNQFAITNSATLRGIVEEHGGTKYKIINCNGSFGVWPYRTSSASPQKPESSIQTLFGGTIQAFSALRNQAETLQNTIKGTTKSRLPSPDVNSGQGGYSGTGYAQALILDQFLEQYSELKKKPENSNWRLAFDIPKQNQTFLVTPLSFSYQQTVESPNEYRFSLQLKAFKRVKLTEKSGEGVQIKLPSPTEANTLQKVLRSITQARQVLGSAYNLVRAVRSDVNTPFNALRELSVVVKDLAGLAATAADLPKNIIEDAKFTLADAVANLPLSSALKAEIQEDIKNTQEFKNSIEGRSIAHTSSGGKNNRTSKVNQLFSTPEKSFELLDSIDLSSVNFSQSALNAIEKENDRISLTTVDDINSHKAVLLDLATQISNAYGTGDETYSRIYGKPKPKVRLQEISIDEYDVLKKLYDVIQDLSILTQTDELNNNQNAAYDFVKAEAEESGLTFVDSTSKVRYPVPFGLTIEQIAARYLGDQERWIEIATLNALNSPYIDENGFTRELLSNGSGRQFNISSDVNLYVGQKINIISTTQPIQKRTILDIEKINQTNFLITVDGLDNLEIFTTVDEAYIHAYLPGTINSQDQVFIPSDLPVDNNLITRPVPATQDDVMTGVSKIDLLLSDNNDIAVNSFGDFRLSFGLTNLFQALKIKFMTEPGSILRHPDFGAGLQHGVSNADVSASNIYNIISALIAQDPRYSGIDTFQVNIDGPTIYVSLTVLAANGLGVFPVSFKLN